jgi:Domain of unknown function (DUF4111)
MPIPHPLQTYFQLLAMCLRAALGPNALGLYVYGSLTQDAFEARRSDLDCVGLLQRRPGAAQLRRLRAQLRELARKDARTRRLQLTLLLKRELFLANGDGWVYQFGRLERTGSDGNPIIWANIRDTGLVVFGPEPAAFLPRLTRRLMQAALVRELGYLREELVSLTSSRWRGRQSYRRYAVLTICRILYTQRTSRVVSKRRAAGWALHNLPPRHQGIVRLATRPVSVSGRQLPLHAIRGLLTYAAARLNPVDDRRGASRRGHVK